MSPVCRIFFCVIEKGKIQGEEIPYVSKTNYLNVSEMLYSVKKKDLVKMKFFTFLKVDFFYFLYGSGLTRQGSPIDD